MDAVLVLTIIGTIVTIAAFNLSRKTYKKDYEEKPNEEKLHLQAQFKSTQKLSHQVYKEFYDYIESYNAFDQYMAPGITYGAYLSQMKESQKVNLSDELLENVLSLDPLPSATIQSMCASLQTQFEALIQIQREVQLKVATLRQNNL